MKIVIIIIYHIVYLKIILYPHKYVRTNFQTKASFPKVLTESVNAPPPISQILRSVFCNICACPQSKTRHSSALLLKCLANPWSPGVMTRRMITCCLKVPSLTLGRVSFQGLACVLVSVVVTSCSTSFIFRILALS